MSRNVAKQRAAGRRDSYRSALTLPELLVVVAIIGAMMALILPAAQQAREAARRVQCRYNLRQWGLAIHNYVDVHQVLPPSCCFSGLNSSLEVSSWSIHGRLLPFLDQQNAAARLNFDFGWNEPVNQQTGIPQMTFPNFNCPSDPVGDVIHYAGADEGYTYPMNYAFNYGTWLIYDPATNSGGDGSFRPNGSVRFSDITDGLSNTLCSAEVKAFQPYIVNSSDPGPAPPGNPTIPADYADGATLMMGQIRDDNEGHTEWCEGAVHQSGFTTVFVPNQCVPFEQAGIGRYDIDWSTRNEGSSATQPTYAAVTARSHHSGLVNVLMMDGSTRVESNQIVVKVWRSLGTINGHE